MSNYFETRTTDGGIQITDYSTIYQVIRSGEIWSNYNGGAFYGFTLDDGEAFATFKVTSGTLIVSPIFIYNGRRVQYVASSGSAIKYKVFGDPKKYRASTHGVGMEIYNANGEIVYSSALDTLTYKLYKSIYAYDSIKNRAGGDPDFRKIMNNFTDAAYSNGSTCYWDSYTYSGHDPYIMSYTMPWSIVSNFPDRNNGRKEYGKHCVTGYDFVNENTFSTKRSPFLISNMSTLNGYGDLHQLAQVVKEQNAGSYLGKIYIYAGIVTTNYMFHVFDSVS